MPHPMPKFHPVLAVFFVIGGLLTALGFYLFVHLQSNASVAASENVRRVIIVFFGMYFACGVIASLIRRMKVRRAAALAAHVSLLLVVLDTHRDGLPIINFVNVAASVIFVIYVLCWGVIVRRGGHTT
jgi:hypothetical protein